MRAEAGTFIRLHLDWDGADAVESMGSGEINVAIIEPTCIRIPRP